MAKLLSIISCVLALAAVTNPAQAGPATKISLTCSSVAPNTITGDTTVTLCADSGPIICQAATFTCPNVQCDSSGVNAAPSTTISCAAPFKVEAILFDPFEYAEYDANGGLRSSQNVPGGIALSKGKFGFMAIIGADVSATVTLKVK